MKSSPLRDLARRYAAGNLPLSDYRAQRSRLIDSYVSGQQEINYRETRPVVLVTPRVWLRWSLIGGLGLFAVMLVSAYVLLPERPGMPETKQPAVERDNPGQTTDPGTVLLEDFLRTGKWDDADLQQLETRWFELTAFQREGARRSLWYRRLEAEIRRRMKEQRVLADINGMPDAQLREARLRTFAQRLGIMSLEPE